MEELKKQLEELEKKMSSQLDEKAKKEVELQMKAIKDQLEALKDASKEIAELKVSVDEADKKAAKAQDDLREYMAEMGRQNANSQPKTKSFSDELGESLEKRKGDLASYNKNERRSIQMELKAVGNMGAANTTISGTTTFAGDSQLGGIGRKPYESVHIRNLIRTQQITTDSAFVIRDNAGEGGPTAVAMGAAKPQSDRDYVKLIVPVTKIAHYFKIPEEMLADISWLQGEISGVGVEELMAKEDNLLLFQAAGAGLFAGLTTATNSTAFAAPASLALAIDNANNYDVLVAAWTQLKTLKSNANYALCNPADYAKMVLTKESTTSGNYVFGAPNIAIPNIFGIPLVPHNEITSDKFLIGDFTKATIGQREGISVRFYDQNEDDAIKNMVTVVIEERLTVVVDRADRLVYGDFSDARAALETA